MRQNLYPYCVDGEIKTQRECNSLTVSQVGIMEELPIACPLSDGLWHGCLDTGSLGMGRLRTQGTYWSFC